MIIKSIFINNFRNIAKADFMPHKGINIFYGNNAQGKTNLLESVCVLATGRSWRSNTDKELLRFGEVSAVLRASIENGFITDTVESYIQKDAKKNILINKIPARSLGELYGKLHTVIFTPEDLSLIKSGPSERRKFIDIELCQLNNLYYENLKKYHHTLKQRNTLLKQAQISKKSHYKDILSCWDEQLIGFGADIIKSRRLFIDEIKQDAEMIYRDIAQKKEIIELIYKPSVTEDNFAQKLQKNLVKDMEFGITAYGPHKDDLLFSVNSADMRVYGSQGQQRSACLAVKLSVAEYIKKHKKITPVLLLDDVFGELDDIRQGYLFNCINETQTFITAAGVDNIIKNKIKPDKIFYVDNGCISE